MVEAFKVVYSLGRPVSNILTRNDSPIMSLPSSDTSQAKVSGFRNDLRLGRLMLAPVNDETTGSLFEIAGGWAAQTRWQRAGGHGFPVDKPLAPEAILDKWNVFTNFGM